jgi:hypothetical protein
MIKPPSNDTTNEGSDSADPCTAVTTVRARSTLPRRTTVSDATAQPTDRAATTVASPSLAARLVPNGMRVVVDTLANRSTTHATPHLQRTAMGDLTGPVARDDLLVTATVWWPRIGAGRRVTTAAHVCVCVAARVSWWSFGQFQRNPLDHTNLQTHQARLCAAQTMSLQHNNSSEQ